MEALSRTRFVSRALANGGFIPIDDHFPARLFTPCMLRLRKSGAGVDELLPRGNQLEG